MDKVRVEAADSRVIEVRFPIAGDDLKTLNSALKDAESQGFALTGGSLIEGGNQRDPTTEGVRLVMTRTRF